MKGIIWLLQVHAAFCEFEKHLLYQRCAELRDRVREIEAQLKGAL